MTVVMFTWRTMTHRIGTRVTPVNQGLAHTVSAYKIVTNTLYYMYINFKLSNSTFLKKFCKSDNISYHHDYCKPHTCIWFSKHVNILNCKKKYYLTIMTTASAITQNVWALIGTWHATFTALYIWWIPTITIHTAILHLPIWRSWNPTTLHGS